MSGTTDPGLLGLDACGCGSGTRIEVPAEVANRPGLPAIAYRAGTHGGFLRSALARLSAAERPQLSRLATREEDDLTIALLDAWAAAGDVLGFYQERIANECYLRTATERLSVRELARLIGYELRPGVAASTLLAFMAEAAPGAFGAALAPRTALPTLPGGGAAPPEPAARIPAGVRVRSVPGPGETSETFETVEAIEARAEWNAIRARLTRRHPILADAATLLFEGQATALKPGDGLILAPDDGGTPVFRRVARVTLQPAQDRTLVALQPVPPPARATVTGPAATVFRRDITLPARSAAASSALAASTLLGAVVSRAEMTVRAQVAGFATYQVHVQATALRPPPPSVRALRSRAAVFGHNAPPFGALPYAQRVGEWAPVQGEDGTSFAFVAGPYAGRSGSWAEVSLASFPGQAGGRVVSLDAPHPGFVAEGFVALVDGTQSSIYRIEAVREVSKAEFTLSAKVTELVLNTGDGLDRFGIRGTSVFGQDEPLPLARLPIPDPVAGKVIELEGFIPGLREGQQVVLCGELATAPGLRACEAARIALVEDVLEAEGGTRITLAAPLGAAYRRETVTICANVAAATHGETVREILGSGDATRAFQRFMLRQPPLTHLRAATATGTRSTLEIRVADLLWHEVEALHGHGPEARIYVTRRREDGTTEVAFGDGRTGARLPTGQGNIRTTYRKGIGLAGQVRADTLTQPMDRPLGVTGVTNPLPAKGGADPEEMEAARANAPLQVLTLGRVVSRRDYEDFARAFAGISKAEATPLWVGERQGILLTLAGPEGATVAPEDEPATDLLAALRAAGDPSVPLLLRSYVPRFFRVAASLVLDPEHEEAAVLAAVRAGLVRRFGFAARRFGQWVARSEVVAAMQAVPGVHAAHVTALHLGTTPGLEEVLRAEAPRPGDDEAVPAELLMLDPRPVPLEVAP
jgi:hypothetical protein